MEIFLYFFQNFISEGIKHIKLMIPGHMVPEKRYVQQ